MKFSSEILRCLENRNQNFFRLFWGVSEKQIRAEKRRVVVVVVVVVVVDAVIVVVVIVVVVTVVIVIVVDLRVTCNVLTSNRVTKTFGTILRSKNKTPIHST